MERQGRRRNLQLKLDGCHSHETIRTETNRTRSRSPIRHHSPSTSCCDHSMPLVPSQGNRHNRTRPQIQHDHLATLCCDSCMHSLEQKFYCLLRNHDRHSKDRSENQCGVKHYVNAVRCYRCQRFGHIAKYCTSTKTSCSICGDDHDYKECQSRDEPCCINCKREGRGDVNHPATSPNCPTYVRFTGGATERTRRVRPKYYTVNHVSPLKRQTPKDLALTSTHVESERQHVPVHTTRKVLTQTLMGSSSYSRVVTIVGEEQKTVCNGEGYEYMYRYSALSAVQQLQEQDRPHQTAQQEPEPKGEEQERPHQTGTLEPLHHSLVLSMSNLHL